MEGSRALSSYSVPPESIVGEARCQPCAINHPLSEGGRQGGDPPPRTGGWKFSCPPRLLKPCAATDRTTTAGLAIRAGPRPEGPRTAATAASPLPPPHAPPPRPPEPPLPPPSPPPPPTSNHQPATAPQRGSGVAIHLTHLCVTLQMRPTLRMRINSAHLSRVRSKVRMDPISKL